jgi:LPXTG-motif cell wall-anchored protein
MLYGASGNASRNSDGILSHSQDPLALPERLYKDENLGALVPHSANTRTTTGGGIGVASTGSGGASGDTTGSPVAPSVQAMALTPAGRGSVVFRGNHNELRFQPTAQGARVSMGSKALALAPGQSSIYTPHDSSSFPAGGLFGLGDVDGFVGWLQQRLAPPRTREHIIKGALVPVTAGFSLAFPNRWVTASHRRSQDPEYIPPRTYTGPGIHPAGLGDLAGFSFKRAFLTIPKSPANIARIALAPFTLGATLFLPTRVLTPPKSIDSALRLVIDKGIRLPVRYAGAVTQTVLFPVLTGSQQRAMFGLSPSESGVFMKAQQIFRGIDAAVLGAAAFAAGPSAFVPGMATTGGPGGGAGLGPGAASLPGQLNYGYAGASYSGLGSSGYTAPGYVTAGQLGGAGGSLPAASSAPSLVAASSTHVLPFVPASSAPALPAGFATPAQIAASAPAAPAAASAPGELTLGKVALGAGKFLGTTAVTTAAQIAVQAALNKGQQAVGGDGAGVGPLAFGGQLPIGAGGSPMSYDPGSAGSDPQLAGMSPTSELVLAGLAVTAIAAGLMARRRRRRSRRG